MQNEDRKGRRRYSGQLKAQIMAECAAPGASVAQVAMAHGLNANVVHRWRQWAREGGPRRTSVSPATPVAATEGFVPIVVSDAPAGAKAEEIHVELRRGATALAVRWPVSVAAQCAVWLRELLH